MLMIRKKIETLAYVNNLHAFYSLGSGAFLMKLGGQTTWNMMKFFVILIFVQGFCSIIHEITSL